MSENPEDEMYWPQFTIPELNYKVLSMNLTTDRALKSADCQFWNDLVPKMRTFTGNVFCSCFSPVFFFLQSLYNLNLAKNTANI